MRTLLRIAVAALLTAIATAGALGQPRCAGLVKQSCLDRYGAGAEIAPQSDCDKQLAAYRRCLVERANDHNDGAAALGPDAASDLRALFKAAVHHYDSYAGRFERRVATGGARAPDLINVYSKRGAIYYYGDSKRSQRAAADQLDRPEVADAYVKVMARIFRESESWRDRRAAFAREAKKLK